MTLTQISNTIKPELTIGSIISSSMFSYGKYSYKLNGEDVCLDYSRVIVDGMMNHPSELVRRPTIGFEEIKYDSFDVDAYDQTRSNEKYLVQSISENYVTVKRIDPMVLQGLSCVNESMVMGGSNDLSESNKTKQLVESLSIYWPYLSHSVNIQQLIIPNIQCNSKQIENGGKKNDNRLYE